MEMGKEKEKENEAGAEEKGRRAIGAGQTANLKAYFVFNFVIGGR